MFTSLVLTLLTASPEAMPSPEELVGVTWYHEGQLAELTDEELSQQMYLWLDSIVFAKAGEFQVLTVDKARQNPKPQVFQQTFFVDKKSTGKFNLWWYESPELANPFFMPTETKFWNWIAPDRALTDLWSPNELWVDTKTKPRKHQPWMMNGVQFEVLSWDEGWLKDGTSFKVLIEPKGPFVFTRAQPFIDERRFEYGKKLLALSLPQGDYVKDGTVYFSVDNAGKARFISEAGQYFFFNCFADCNRLYLDEQYCMTIPKTKETFVFHKIDGVMVAHQGAQSFAACQETPAIVTANPGAPVLIHRATP